MIVVKEGADVLLRYGGEMVTTEAAPPVPLGTSTVSMLVVVTVETVMVEVLMVGTDGV